MDEKKFPLHRKVEYDHGSLVVDSEPIALIRHGYEFWGNRTRDESLNQIEGFSNELKAREFTLTESGIIPLPRLESAQNLQTFALDALSAGFDIRYIPGSYQKDSGTIEANTTGVAVFGRFSIDRFITRTTETDPILQNGYQPTGHFFKFEHWGDFGLLTPEQHRQNSEVVSYIRTSEAKGEHIRLLEKNDGEGNYILFAYGRPKGVPWPVRFSVERPLSGFSNESPQRLVALGFQFIDTVKDDKTLDTTAGAVPIALDPLYIQTVKELKKHGFPKKTRKPLTPQTLREMIIEELRYGKEMRIIAGSYDPVTGALDAQKQNQVSIFRRFDIGRFIEPTTVTPEELKKQEYRFSNNMPLNRWGDSVDTIPPDYLQTIKEQILQLERYIVATEKAGFHVRLLQGWYGTGKMIRKVDLYHDGRSVAIFLKKKK